MKSNSINSDIIKKEVLNLGETSANEVDPGGYSGLAADIKEELEDVEEVDLEGSSGANEVDLGEYSGLGAKEEQLEDVNEEPLGGSLETYYVEKYQIKDCHVILEQMRPDKIKSKDKHVCEYCTKSFNSRWKLQTHLNFHRGYKQYSCNMCPKKFVTKGNLSIHVKTHERNRERLHGCNVCDKAFYTHPELKQHNNIHTQSKQYPCSLCSKIFHFSQTRLEHINGIHKLLYKCTFCGKHLAAKLSLKTHISHVHGQFKGSPCPICKKEIKELKKHIASVHSSNKKMFPCPQCPATLARNSFVKTHVESVHLGVTKYCCDKCGKKFYYRSHLINHMRRHFSVKSFYCRVCRKKFGSNHKLKKHRILHFGKRNYSCGHCCKKFKYKYNIKKHIRKVHLT